jgi:hypothetical protein
MAEANAGKECGAHAWRSYTDEEMKALRSETRAGRPSGAWVEAAEQCENCGAIETSVSWWGQVHRVPFRPKVAGGPSLIHWPTRAQASGGSTGMGQNQ